MVKSKVSFGKLMEELRVARGMNQAAFAAWLGVDRQTIHRWARGHAPLPGKRAGVILKVAAVDAGRATAIAACFGKSLAQLGVAAPEAPKPVPVVPHDDAVLAALCDAAEHVDVSPKMLRPALAVFVRGLVSRQVSAADAAKVLEVVPA